MLRRVPCHCLKIPSNFELCKQVFFKSQRLIKSNTALLKIASSSSRNSLRAIMIPLFAATNTREILQKELDYEEFKNKYNETVENQLINNIIENRKKTFYYEITENKTELNKQIEDLKAPGNKWKFESSVTPHDHIHPQHWQKDPEKTNEEKWKYLAYFDIVIDQHLRQVRPSSISEYEEIYKYVKDQNKPLRHTEDHSRDNMYYDYLYTLENEFYVKFIEDITEYFENNATPAEPEDKVN